MIEEAVVGSAIALRGLQALWKEVGPMPQRRSKELWEQFKAACDQVYDKVKGVRAVETEKFAEVTAVKEALIAEAEALAESTDWAATAEKLKALQAKWKDSGHLPRKLGDDLWKRFRAACDKFFERRKPQLEARQNEESQNLAKKHALIARAQAVANKAPDDGGWGKAISQIKELQRDWKEIGFVPRRDADAVYAAFRAACDSLFQKRDASRDAEANAHRAEIDALKIEIDAATAEGDVTRALAARAKATELDALGAEVQAMVRHLVTSKPEAVKGTELDPTAPRTRREADACRELLRASAQAQKGDVAAQARQRCANRSAICASRSGSARSRRAAREWRDSARLRRRRKAQASASTDDREGAGERRRKRDDARRARSAVRSAASAVVAAIAVRQLSRIPTPNRSRSSPTPRERRRGDRTPPEGAR